MKCFFVPELSSESFTHQHSQTKTRSYKKKFVDFI